MNDQISTSQTGKSPAANRAVALAVALAIQVGGMHAANAQESTAAAAKADDTVLEQVVVTGSRILRRDYQANSPIQTIDSAALEDKAGIAIENTLNKLPQFVPAATEYTQIATGELINTGSVTTAGAATLSLRGFGPNRNLVLIDGLRAVPVNATMAVDINTVPAAAIERVETITGGASSVYGADAVAGVVNFILKKDFNGINLDAQYGAMQNGHAGETKVSALIGSNSSNGRGNVMIGLEYVKREGVEWNDVKFYEKALRDPTTSGTIYIDTDPYINFGNGDFVGSTTAGSVIDGIFNRAPANTVLRSGGVIGGRVYLNQDGTVYTGASIFNGVSPPGAGSTAGLYRYKGPFTNPDGTLFRKIDGQGFLQEYIPNLKANVPLKRYSMFGKGEYELSDDISLHVQGNIVESSTFQLWQVSPATGGWSSTIPHGTGIYAPSVDASGNTLVAYRAGGQFGLNCPATGGCTNTQAFPVSPELAALLDARTNPNATYNLSYSLDFPYYGFGLPRSIDTTQRTAQFQVGLRGKLPDFLDSTWDVTVSHGSSTLGILKEGYASLSQVRTILQSPNYGKGFFAQANSGPPGNAFAGGVATCTSGIPVFSPHAAISQDCVDAMIVELQDQSRMLQDDVVANFQGHLANLPAGEARFSIGGEYRKNDYRYVFDHLNTQTSFLDLGIGTFPANSTRGATSVKELYGELLVPLLKEIPLIEHMNLELGYRHSDYRFQGGIETYKALLDWGVTPALRVRGGYQKATRAPNIAEMFQAESQTWGFGVPGDPCGINTLAAYGANAALNPNSAAVRTLCSQIMGAGAAGNFYGPGAITPSGTGGLYFVNVVGNPKVNPEDSTTWTAGLVFQPHLDNPLLAGFSSTIDWYSIKIDGMIAPESGLAVYQACLSPSSNPTYSASNEACKRILRNPDTGGMTAVYATYLNTGKAKLSGIDMSFDWKASLSDMGMESAPGRVGVNVMFSKLLTLDTQASAAAPVIDWVGSLGPSPGTSLNSGAFSYRVFTTFTYGNGGFNSSLRWRHLPSAVSEAQAQSTTKLSLLGAESSYDVFDFSAAYSLNSTLQLRAGIDNVFNTPPIITGARSASDPQPTSGQGVTNPGFYNTLGRQFYVGVKANF